MKCSLILVALLSGCSEPDWRVAVEQQLVDPGSAEYRDLKEIEESRAGGSSVCGEVNSRNRMGGYNGFRRFFFRAGSARIEPDTSVMGVMDKRALRFRTMYILACSEADNEDRG